MKVDEIKTQLAPWLKKLGKYKYAVFVLLVGIILMCLPFEEKIKEPNVEVNAAADEYDLEMQLEEILADIDGAGSVNVLLSVHMGSTHTYQEDKQIKRTSDTEEVQSKTVILSGDGTQLPVETVCKYPTYRGAVVVCQGADKASVRLAIIQAVASATGLGSDHIAVIKMKGK